MEAEAQKQRGTRRGPLLMEKAGGLERPIVGIVGRCAGFKGIGRLAVQLAILPVQLRGVVRPDQVAEVFKQLDHGKRLLRRPVSGNGEGDCQEQSGRGRARDFVSIGRTRFGVVCGNAFGRLTAAA